MNQHPNTDFRIDIHWPDRLQEQERDLASIRMAVGEAMLTRVAEVQAETNRDYLRLSGVSLALWFADNWWRLRWEAPADGRLSPEWRARHELSSGGGGSIWPPVMIYGTGQRMVFAPALGQPPQTGPIRFLETDQVHSVEATRYEQVIDAFFHQVVGQCARATDAAALETIVKQLEEERASGDISRWRKLEARLGYDPEDAPSELIEELIAAEQHLGESAVEEAANASAGPSALDDLKEVVSAAEQSSLELDFDFARATSSMAPRSRTSQPWQQAEDTAFALRKRLSISDQPLSTKQLCDLLQVSHEKFKVARASASRMRYGARLGGLSHRERIALQSRYPRDRRFEIARMIGDVIWSDNEPLGVISRAKTDRQKFQRAFAQSFLVPVETLMRETDAERPERDIERMARTFDVHPNVISTMLVNKNVLPRDSISDRLEAA